MLNGISAHAPRPAGRHRAPPRRRRIAVTAPGIALITIAALAALAGCSSGASSSGPESAAAGSAVHGGAAAPAASAPAAAPAAAASASAAGPANGGVNNGFAASGTAKSAGGGVPQGTAARVAPADVQLIYTAELTVRAKNVGAALSMATSIVTAAGGYVSTETTSGEGSGQPASAATANVTLKIPAAVYPATLARLTGPGLGTQLSLQQQAQDVTQQVADVGSLVTSDEAAITQLRALLKDAGSVTDLLGVQDQINSETSNLEAMLAQQQALNHETAYATVTLTLVGPKPTVKPKPKVKHKPVPPPGLASGLTGGWRAFRLSVDWLLAVVGAVAPFAAAAVVIAGGVWWIRRRIARGASAADGES